MTGSIHEECGVFGVCAPEAVAAADLLYYGLYALQHRGQESAGIVVNDDGVFTVKKDMGLVNDVFSRESLSTFPEGSMAVGHVRYGTTGATNPANCQPITVNHQKGKLALAHNGNLSNAYELREELELNGAIFHSTSDTEIIAYIVTQERLREPSIEAAVAAAMARLEGAYSLVMMSSTKMIAARDPHGFRPLCYGKREDGTYIVASETCALAAVGARFVRDLLPGEILVFDGETVTSDTRYVGTKEKKTCIFEYLYFARPDSVIDGISVHMTRQKAGMILADIDEGLEADVVIGVPDSGLDAALGYSIRSGIPYGIGFVKNKYIGRTFISPGQNNRVSQVKIKLNPIKETVAGKRVVVIDDSIVRGTTSKQMVSLLREAGAKEVHMRSSAPKFLHPCYYGTDIDSEENLIACHYTTEEIAEIIGADTLEFLPVEDLERLNGNCEYCDACFSGTYATAIPTNTSKDRFEAKLSERPKKKKK